MARAPACKPHEAAIRRMVADRCSVADIERALNLSEGQVRYALLIYDLCIHPETTARLRASGSKAKATLWNEMRDWCPPHLQQVYRSLRRAGHSPEDAQRLVEEQQRGAQRTDAHLDRLFKAAEGPVRPAHLRHFGRQYTYTIAGVS